MNILQVEYNQINNITKDFLDKVTMQGLNLGKKENNHWIIKTSTIVDSRDPNERQQVQLLNTFIQASLQTGYTNIMIIDK